MQVSGRASEGGDVVFLGERRPSSSVQSRVAKFDGLDATVKKASSSLLAIRTVNIPQESAIYGRIRDFERYAAEEAAEKDAEREGLGIPTRSSSAHTRAVGRLVMPAAFSM